LATTAATCAGFPMYTGQGSVSSYTIFYLSAITSWVVGSTTSPCTNYGWAQIFQ
jgi:hypothetical protein